MHKVAHADMHIKIIIFFKKEYVYVHLLLSN